MKFIQCQKAGVSQKNADTAAVKLENHIPVTAHSMQAHAVFINSTLHLYKRTHKLRCPVIDIQDGNLIVKRQSISPIDLMKRFMHEKNRFILIPEEIFQIHKYSSIQITISRTFLQYLHEKTLITLLHCPRKHSVIKILNLCSLRFCIPPIPSPVPTSSIRASINSRSFIKYIPSPAFIIQYLMFQI